MNTVVQALLHLVVDLRTESGQAAEGRLDVPTGTAKPVVEIEMPEGRVKIVAPHQANDPATEPDAFRVPGRAVDSLRRFNEFVGFMLIVLGGIGGICGRRFAGLVLGCAALGEGGPGTDQKCKPGNGEVTQNRIFNIQHPWTHKFPDLLPARSQPDAAV
jgi:hypothetical protein